MAPEAVGRPDWLHRHHLVWISPAHHAAISSQNTDAALASVAARFLAAGAPLVICRQSRLDTGTQFSTTRIAAGLPLPPSLGKRRLAFMIQPDTIARSAHPLALTDIIPHLPVEWRRPLLQLSRGGEAIGLEFRVYGSAAWEALTGLSYLTPESDIDLLWRPTGTAQLADGIALLANWEAATGRHVDGEILFRDDDAVAWREWAEAERKHASPRFLVKSLAGPRLCTRVELQARLSRREEAMALCH